MTEDQIYVKNHPEMLGLKMEFMRWLKVAETNGNHDMVKRLKSAISVCDNPPDVPDAAVVRDTALAIVGQ